MAAVWAISRVTMPVFCIMGPWHGIMGTSLPTARCHDPILGLCNPFAVSFEISSAKHHCPRSLAGGNTLNFDLR